MFVKYVISKGSCSESNVRAAEIIDSLTYNRVEDFDKLTEHQKRVINRVYSRLSAFINDNGEILDTYLSNYSINGVSMSFAKSWNIKVIGGIAIPGELYSQLLSTGLCYPAI